MEHTFLKPPHQLFFGCALASLFSGCSFFNDPSLELDPALENSNLVILSRAEHFQVPRKHVLESFGSFGCVSCPGAESMLLPYIYPALNSPGYNPTLIVANYHVKFGTINDPWVTAGTQARYDESFSNSLPQATMDGSNAQFGIRETDVEYAQGEYDSLVYRLRTLDSLTYLDLGMDTTQLAYDSTDSVMRIHFMVLNRDTVAQGPLSFRVLAVKNLPVAIPIYPAPWAVIVVETTDEDSADRSLVMAGLPPLTAKSFSVALSLPPNETQKQGITFPEGMETPGEYALIVIAKDTVGVVRNVFSYKYGPK